MHNIDFAYLLFLNNCYSKQMIINKNIGIESILKIIREGNVMLVYL